MAKAAKKKPLTWKPKVETRTVVVDNPYYSRSHDTDGGNRLKIEAQVNVRESAIGVMAARGHLDPAQVQAATRFRALWEALGGAGAGSFDYSREPVDGGGARDPISVRQLDAGFQLSKCRELLGIRCYDIIAKVAGEGYAIGDIGTSQNHKKAIGFYIKDGLDVLAEHWGYKTLGDNRKSA